MVRTMVATPGWDRLGIRVSRLVMKWVRSARGGPTGSGKRRSDSVLQFLVGIGDDQFHSAEAPGVQRAQEGQPEGAVLAGAHIHAQHFPLTGRTYCRSSGGHHHADVDPSEADVRPL